MAIKETSKCDSLERPDPFSGLVRSDIRSSCGVGKYIYSYTKMENPFRTIELKRSHVGEGKKKAPKEGLIKFMCTSYCKSNVNTQFPLNPATLSANEVCSGTEKDKLRTPSPEVSSTSTFRETGVDVSPSR